MKLVWSGFSDLRLATAIFLLVALHAGQLSAQHATNLEILSSLVDSALEGLLGNVAGRGECVSVLSLDPASDGNWLMESRLFELFSRNGILVRVPGRIPGRLRVEPPDSCQILLEYKVLSLGVQYQGERTATILTRTAQMHIYLRTISTVTGEVGVSKTLKASKSDTVAHDRILELENKALPFTKGETHWRDGGIKIIRPLVVSAAAGVIVYLFYSLRSR